MAVTIFSFFILLFFIFFWSQWWSGRSRPSPSPWHIILLNQNEKTIRSSLASESFGGWTQHPSLHLSCAASCRGDFRESLCCLFACWFVCFAFFSSLSEYVFFCPRVKTVCVSLSVMNTTCLKHSRWAPLTRREREQVSRRWEGAERRERERERECEREGVKKGGGEERERELHWRGGSTLNTSWSSWRIWHRVVLAVFYVMRFSHGRSLMLTPLTLIGLEILGFHSLSQTHNLSLRLVSLRFLTLNHLMDSSFNIFKSSSDGWITLVASKRCSTDTTPRGFILELQEYIMDLGTYSYYNDVFGGLC